MTFDYFIENYYFITSVVIFFVTYTAIIIYDKVKGSDTELESYAMGFIIIALCSVMWGIVLPILILIFLFYGYILLIRYITNIYVKRNRS